MKSLTILLSLLLISLACARDFRPPSHLENIPASNSSIQECYVFQTTPGVAYTVEVSNNLSDWTTQDELYGLGGEYAVAMREFTPPPPLPPLPPLPPGTPPAVPPTLATNVSLRLQPASGVAGGSIVAWRSLDHDGPMIVRIAAEIDPAWSAIPIFWDRFADYNFYFWHPGTQVAAPVENPPLGPNDSAMLAVLEASVPSINQQIAASIVRSRNAPPPAPPAPDSKRFWRVKVDWSLDTDSDGSPDWAEFEIAAHSTGMLFPGVIGDPFDADTNNDGIPDGQQLDADGDGTPDAKDPDSTDNTSVLPFGPIPRYALFEIPGNALQINDLGTVIFPTKVWKAGVLNDLPGGGTGEPPASARAINDLDVILGTVGTRPDLPDHPSFVIGDICYWPSPTSTYETIHVEDDGETVNAYRQHDGIYQQGPAPVLTNSGHFIAQGNVVDPPLEYWDEFDYYPTLWQIPIGTAIANRQESPAGAAYLSSPSLMWGVVSPPPAGGNRGAVFAPAALPSIPFVPLNVNSQPLPKGGAAIFATPPLNLFGSASSLTAQVYVDGKWRKNELYANAIDIAGDGTAIGRDVNGIIAPILLNDQWTGIERTAPSVPIAWNNPSIKLIDTTPRGWVLGRDITNSNSAALLPIRVEGEYTRTKLNLDNTHTTDRQAAGVDAFSITSFAPGNAVQDRIWIMAPQNSTGNVIFKAPLTATATLKLSAAGITFSGQDDTTLAAEESPFTIQAKTTATTGQDVLLDLKMDTAVSISKPVGIKIMKNRVVKVNVFEVARRQSPNGPYAYVTHVPSAADITTHLNDMFKPQINVSFDVKLITPAIALAWDGNANETLDTDAGGQYSPEQDAILASLPTTVRASDITVLIIGSSKNDGTVVMLDKNSYGSTNRTGTNARPGPTCWILGEYIGKQSDMDAQLDTIAHEVGHVFVDYGHPDQVLSQGHAPLPGTRRLMSLRLMCSGPKSGSQSRLLVKGEWDEAEEWLKAKVDTRP